MQAALGFDRTFQMTVEWMEAFEEELRAEMVENKAKYVGNCGGEKEYETWLQLNVGHKVNHPVRYAMAQPCARTHTHTHTRHTTHSRHVSCSHALTPCPVSCSVVQAHTWILDYRRRVMYSTAHLPTLMHENFTLADIYFDMLHAMLNTVKDIVVEPMRDICELNLTVPKVTMLDAFRGRTPMLFDTTRGPCVVACAMPLQFIQHS